MSGASNSLAERIDRLDLTLFDAIAAQLSPGDRRSLLALHAACRRDLDSFSYLEIGSHLGGSLQAFVCDAACTAVASIDSRPATQPDERGIVYRYERNSRSRMLENLGALPGAATGKIATYEASTAELEPESIPRPDLCFVDGEHTDDAALRDARFCRRVLRERGVIAFHDAQVIYGALDAFTAELREDFVPFEAYVLPDAMFVVELGQRPLRETEPLATQAREGYRGYLWALEQTTPYREDYRRLLNRLIRRARRALPWSAPSR